MLLSHLLAAAMIVPGPAVGAGGLTMRVNADRLDPSAPAGAEALAGRIADESRRFCAVHVETVTPAHVGDRRMCERAMADAAVSTLSPQQWRAFVRAGGASALRRAQR